MTYDELMQTIRSTSAEEWIEHDMQGVHTFQGDLNIRIEHQRDRNDGQFHEDWAQKHPDPSATKEHYSIFYGASLVHTFILVSVDGGRAYLPMPCAGTTVIPLEDYQLARIVDNGSLTEYIGRSGLTVEN